MNYSENYENSGIAGEKRNHRKVFILDTSVLIHDPDSLFQFQENDIIIPLPVIEELDGLKKNMHPTTSFNARKAIKGIESIIDPKNKNTLKKGALLEIRSVNKQELTADMNKAVKDNLIIAVAYEAHEQFPERQVVFVTKDFNARIKARFLGVVSEDYETNLVEYNKLYKGWRYFQPEDELLGQLEEHGKIEKPAQFKLQPNEYIIFKNKSMRYFSNEREVVVKQKGNDLITLENSLKAMNVTPMDSQQQIALDLLLNPDVKLVSLVGGAGTGKTLLALAAGLHQILKVRNYDKLMASRPTVPMGRDIGYLPGSKESKIHEWMFPFYDNLEFIFNDFSQSKDDREKTNISMDENNPIDYLKGYGLLDIDALTYIRGRSIARQFIVIDETQNLSPLEIKTIVSRAGEGTKIVLTGDPEQIDSPYLDINTNGLSHSVDKMKKENLYGHVFLTDSKRSELAKVAIKRL